MDNLSTHPQIIELMETLEKNDMLNEKKEVQSLVNYIGDMETTLSEMLKEMQGMRHEINLIHNNSMKAKCLNLLQRTEDKIRQAVAVASRAKDHFIESASNALKAYKEKGKEAFRKAVHAMKIPEALDRLASLFYKMSKETEQSMKQMNSMQSELNSAKGHLRNVGSLLVFRTAKDVEQNRSDKGVLSRLGKALGKVSSGFEQLSQKAMDASDKIRVSHVKESVRTELDSLKVINNGHSISNPQHER